VLAGSRLDHRNLHRDGWGVDGAMTPQMQTQAMSLCPHLAAAALWMTKPPRKTRRKAGIQRLATDDLTAL
jgi:hypothetical protein